MQAVIMAGGKGTRLFPLTNRLPKPMVDFLNRPTLEHLMRNLAAAEPEEVVMTLGYRHEAVSRHFGDGAEFGLRISYSVESQPLGTAGGVKALEHLLSDTFMVLSGDAVCDLDLEEPLRFHRAQGADVTLVLTRVENPLEFGIVVTDEQNRVTRFLEKPKTWGEVFTDVVNTGIYVIEPHVLRHVPAGTFYDFSRDLFPRLLSNGARIYGMLTDAYWCDVGNLVQYRQAHFDALTGKVRISLGHSREISPGVYLQNGARISRQARLHPPVLLGPGASIAAEATVGPFAVVGSGVQIGAGASVTESVVLRGTKIGRHASLVGCVVAEETVIKPDTAWQHVAADRQHLTRVARRPEAPLPPGFAARREWRRMRGESTLPAPSSATSG